MRSCWARRKPPRTDRISRAGRRRIFQEVGMTGAGIEPATTALKVRCSTTELPGPVIWRFVIG
jgi:hypothetical protein